MRKLAVRDERLLSIDKTAHYIDGKYNSVMKGQKNVDVRFAMCS